MANERVARQRRRRRPTRAGQLLSTELIVATCLRLIEEHGAEALSVRRLGAALGADGTAIYRYFRNKDELLLAVADELIGRTLSRFRATDDWVADLRRFALGMYETALAHPRAAVLASWRVTGRDNEIRAVETLLGIFRAAGFDAASAVRYYHAFVDLVLACSAQDAAVRTLGPASLAAAESAWRDTYGRLPPGDFPHIAAGARHLRTNMTASAFPTILELFLSALRDGDAPAGRNRSTIDG